MEFKHCVNCNKRIGFKRVLSFGTLFLVVLTCGFWLLAIPFYPKRCIVCGISEEQNKRELEKLQNKEPYLGFLTIVGIILAIWFIVAIVDNWN